MKREIIYRLITILALLVLGMVILFVLSIKPIVGTYDTVQKELSVSDVVNTTDVAKVSRFYTYGTHFSVEGELVLTEEFASDIEKFEFVLKQIDEEYVASEAVLDFDAETGTLTFDMSDKINLGICLDDLSIGKKFAFIKATLTDGSEKYFTMTAEDPEGYGSADIEYFTVTRNGKNNKINIGFCYDSTPFLGLTVEAVDELPEDVYDIVLDPGHGGSSPGACSPDGKIREDVLNLKHANELAEILREMGYKVYITRDGTEDPTVNFGHHMYGEDGKLTKAMRTGAKLYLAVHCNATNGDKLSRGGFEIYISPEDDYTFANSVVSNVIKYSGTIASQLEAGYKVAPGVYARRLLPNGIKDIKARAKKYGFEVYDIDENTPYYYYIRETGGIVTHAYVDGRDPEYEANLFVHTNKGMEGYLLELAYMDCWTDLYYVLDHYEEYCQGIAVSVDEYFQ